MNLIQYMNKNFNFISNKDAILFCMKLCIQAELNSLYSLYFTNQDAQNTNFLLFLFFLHNFFKLLQIDVFIYNVVKTILWLQSFILLSIFLKKLMIKNRKKGSNKQEIYWSIFCIFKTYLFAQYIILSLFELEMK